MYFHFINLAILRDEFHTDPDKYISIVYTPLVTFGAVPMNERVGAHLLHIILRIKCHQENAYLAILVLETEYSVVGDLGAVSIRKTVLPGMAIPMLKIRRPNGRLIFNMEIAIRR